MIKLYSIFPDLILFHLFTCYPIFLECLPSVLWHRFWFSDILTILSQSFIHSCFSALTLKLTSIRFLLFVISCKSVFPVNQVFPNEIIHSFDFLEMPLQVWWTWQLSKSSPDIFLLRSRFLFPTVTYLIDISSQISSSLFKINLC